MTQKINYIENSDELAVNLKKAREKAELTQKQVSKMVSIERSSLSCYEIGRSLPSIFTLIKLSEIYRISIYQLITK
jgi:Predicted transcriptional regulator